MAESSRAKSDGRNGGSIGSETLDGLLLLKFTDYPLDELDMMLKDVSPEEKAPYYKRFGKE